MANFHALQLPPPKHWQEFEELCADLWDARQDTKHTQPNGRTGQKQNGVDIFGQMVTTNEWFGVQCKGKDSRYGCELSKQELMAEVEKAKSFSPKLSTFTLATTAPNDALIQKIAREITVRHEKQNLFSVEVKSWDEIQRELSLYPDVVEKYFPQFKLKTHEPLCDTNCISNQMPPPRFNNTFIGRKNELNKLTNYVKNESLIQICGVGGIGKSELLLQALKSYDSEMSIIWCNVEKYNSVDDLILALTNVFRKNNEEIKKNDLPRYFDKHKILIVFDGIEKNNVEELEDIINDWHSQTKHCKFVITTQVEIYSFSNQVLLKLKSLTKNESRLLFMEIYGKILTKKDQELDELMDFCDGHALTIKFASSLSKYYGNVSQAIKAINKNKSSSLKIPARINHTRHTSLDICLQTAYQFLSIESKKLLWALAESPAGVCTNLLDNDWLDINNTHEAFASLKRWQFIDEIDITESISRTRMLTPIRNFISNRALADNPVCLEEIILKLAYEAQLWIAVIETEYNQPQNHQYMMCRYEDELPNLVNIIELALKREENSKLTEIAVCIASCIMPYYFVLGAPKVGVEILKNVTRLVIKSGDVVKANDIFQRYSCLAKRARNKELNHDSWVILSEIESMPGSDKIHTELSFSKAIAASDDDYEYGDDSLVVKYASEAIHGFRKKIKNLNSKQSQYDLFLTELKNNLSYSYGILGNSLFNQGKAEQALDAYHNCLKFQNKAIQSTNIGQTYHQIGKCHMKLKNGELAVKCLTYSTQEFLFSGMKEYISHSFSELGYSLLMLDINSFDNLFSEEAIDLILLDLKECTLQNFDTITLLNDNSYRYNIRKLMGTFFFLSLVGLGSKLNTFTLELSDNVRSIFFESKERSHLLNENKFSIYILDKTLEFGHAISCVEYEKRSARLHSSVSHLLKIACEIDFIVDCKTFKITQWLSVYFRHILGCKEIEPERLEQFIYNYNNSIPDNFDPFSK